VGGRGAGVGARNVGVGTGGAGAAGGSGGLVIGGHRAACLRARAWARARRRARHHPVIRWRRVR